MRKSNKTLLSLFGDDYSVFEHNGGYILYDKKRKSSRSNFKYLGKFYISNDKTKFVFNDECYSDVTSLVDAIDEYNKTLPFDSEIYNPIVRKNCRIEYALHDYLEELGFEMVWKHMEAIYTLKDVYGEIICSVTFDVKEDTTEGKLTKIISGESKYTFSCIDVPFTDLDSAIGACNTLLSAYLLQLSSKTIHAASKMTNSRVSKIMKKTFDTSTLETYIEDEKKHIIEYLESELRMLKQE